MCSPERRSAYVVVTGTISASPIKPIVPHGTDPDVPPTVKPSLVAAAAPRAVPLTRLELLVDATRSERYWPGAAGPG